MFYMFTILNAARKVMRLAMFSSSFDRIKKGGYYGKRERGTFNS